MAERNEELNRSENEPSSHTDGGTNPSRHSMPDVNFDEMNFEQRRAPYKGGKQNISYREQDKIQKDKDERRSRNGR
jgi:hypothetical protein